MIKQREKEKLKKRAQGLKKKVRSSVPIQGKSAYKCPQTAGKALKRAATGLLSSPTGRNEVIR